MSASPYVGLDYDVRFGSKADIPPLAASSVRLVPMTGQTNYRRDCLWTVEEALDGSAEARDRNLFERIF